MFRVLHSMNSASKGVLPICLYIQANSVEEKAVELFVMVWEQDPH